MGIFLRALTGLGLLYELDAYVQADEETHTDDEVRQAAALILPASHGAEDDHAQTEDEDDGDDFDAVQEARHVRAVVFEQWRAAALSLHHAQRTLALFPWLKPWADARMQLKRTYVALLQQQAQQLVAADALLAAAAVTAMDTPDLPADDPAFAVLGGDRAVLSQLRMLWNSWRCRASGSWEHPREQSYVAYSLVHGMGSRRKGRDGAVERAHGLVAAWTATAQAGADGEHPKRTVLAGFPLQEAAESSARHGAFRDRLSEWELGVLATWTVSVDWERATTTLRVPEPVAARLLSSHSVLSCVEPGRDQPVRTQEQHGRVEPGVFDDVPVSDRRVVTVGHLRALRAFTRDAEQLYLVLSITDGPEVLALSVLEQRVAAGGQYVIVAGASDLPESLLASRHEADQKTSTQDEGRVWIRSDHEPDHADFGRSLSMAEGERMLVRLSEGLPNTDADSALRSLLLARGARDLRDLRDGYDSTGERRRIFPSAVWHGLLAMDQLSLEPFEPVCDDAWSSGSGLPLGVLAQVQLYSTDAAGKFQGRAHSPACPHQRGDYGPTRDYDLVTVEEMLGTERFDPCSKCGGYATRRLSEAQVSYYRAAHQVHDLCGQVRRALAQRELGWDVISLEPELKKWESTAVPEEWFGERSQARQWRRVISGMYRQWTAA
ncbi:hypothetical protein ACWGNE_09250, partial [Streptomyces xiamenensis]